MGLGHGTRRYCEGPENLGRVPIRGPFSDPGCRCSQLGGSPAWAEFEMVDYHGIFLFNYQGMLFTYHLAKFYCITVQLMLENNWKTFIQEQAFEKRSSCCTVGFQGCFEV